MAVNNLCKYLLLFVSVFCKGQNQALISATYAKLKSDAKSFEQFAFYGFCNCNDTYLYSQTYDEQYTTTFNHLEPLPRFFEREVIREALKSYHTAYSNRFDALQKTYYNGYQIVAECYKMYDVSNKKLKKIYLRLLSDERQQAQWSEIYMKDYLTHYFIHVETE